MRGIQLPVDATGPMAYITNMCWILQGILNIVLISKNVADISEILTIYSIVQKVFFTRLTKISRLTTHKTSLFGYIYIYFWEIEATHYSLFNDIKDIDATVTDQSLLPLNSAAQNNIEIYVYTNHIYLEEDLH